MLKKISNRGGLRFHEWKVQMGLPQGDLLTLQESFQAAEGTNSRRVLPGLRLQPQIRYPAAQRSSAAKTGGNNLQEASFPPMVRTVILSLTAIWEAAGYPLLGQRLQSSPTVVGLRRGRIKRRWRFHSRVDWVQKYTPF